MRCRMEEGHILLVALALVLILSLLGMTSLYLASQDAMGVRAMRAEKMAQRAADAAADMVVSWFHDPAAAPSAVAGSLAKQQGDDISGPSFFDAAGRSQFRGTVDRPDLLFNAANPIDDQILNELDQASPLRCDGSGAFSCLEFMDRCVRACSLPWT